MLTGEDVADYRPDWILIETENLTRFGDSTILAEAIDEKELIPIYAFYAAAARDELDGYFLAAENGAQALFQARGRTAFRPRHPAPARGGGARHPGQSPDGKLTRGRFRREEIRKVADRKSVV